MSKRVSEKVAWTEGVLLVPQHFQQLDRYHESLLAFRLEAIEPLSWGALSIEMDLRKLQQGLVALASFRGILPDGTPLVIGQGDQHSPAARALHEVFSPTQRSLTVYVGIPEERSRTSNFAYENEELRYRVYSRKVYDVSRDNREAELSFVIPNAKLVFEGESLDGLNAMPIAEITRDERGGYIVSDTYIPPCLRIGASQAMQNRLARLLAAMVTRLRVLQESRRVTGEARVEFNAADVTTYLQLSAISGMLPAVQYLSRTPSAPPRAAFLLLSQLAGQLSTFSPDIDMTEPLDFDFDNLTKTFGTLFDLNERMLSILDAERFISCTLTPGGVGRHQVELHDVRVQGCARFLLSVQSQLPRHQLVQEFVTKAKVAAYGDMDIVLNKNIGGLKVTESPRPPVELPSKPGLVYFDLPDAGSDVYWKHVIKDRNLVVWLPPLLDESGLVIKLIGVFGSRDRTSL